MNTKTLLIIGGVLVALCCIGIVAIAAIGGIAGVGMTQPAADSAETFLTALKNGNYAQAYNLCSTDLQTELGSAADLEALIVNNNVQPTQWSFSSRNVSGNMAELTGSVTLTGNRAGSVRVTLTQSGNNWLVAGFNLKEK